MDTEGLSGNERDRLYTNNVGNSGVLQKSSDLRNCCRWEVRWSPMVHV